MTDTAKRIEMIRLLQKRKVGDELPGDTILRALREPIAIGGLWLDAHSGRIKVRVEIDGKWCDVLDEANDGGHISHIVEPAGLRDRAQLAPDPSHG